MAALRRAIQKTRESNDSQASHCYNDAVLIAIIGLALTGEPTVLASRWGRRSEWQTMCYSRHQETVAKALGLGSTSVIGVQERDNLATGISHLPMLLSTALVSLTTDYPSWPKISRLASSGYRDFTHLASGNLEVNASFALAMGQPYLVGYRRSLRN